MTSVLKVDNIQNSSGTDAISIDSNGVIAQPTLQHWSGYHDAVEVPGVDGTIANWTVTESNGITESSGVWTIPKAGLYFVSTSLLNSVAETGVYWNLNSTRQWRISYATPPSGGYAMQSGSLIHQFSAGDTLKFTSQTATASFYGTTLPNAVGEMCIYKIG